MQVGQRHGGSHQFIDAAALMPFSSDELPNDCETAVYRSGTKAVLFCYVCMLQLDKVC